MEEEKVLKSFLKWTLSFLAVLWFLVFLYRYIRADCLPSEPSRCHKCTPR